MIYDTSDFFKLLIKLSFSSLALQLSVQIISVDKVIFLHSMCFSLMKLINSNISFEISKPAFHGASFVPTFQMTYQVFLKQRNCVLKHIFYFSARKKNICLTFGFRDIFLSTKPETVESPIIKVITIPPMFIACSYFLFSNLCDFGNFFTFFSLSLVLGQPV